MPKVDGKPLAYWRGFDVYTPAAGDFLVWTGWITTWHGIVTDYDPTSGSVYILFDSVMANLLNLTPREEERARFVLNLSDIKSASRGTYAALQFEAKSQTGIWYI